MPDSTLAPGGPEGYRLLDLLGRGGFGEVWRAEAPGGVKVAVKILSLTLKPAEAKRELAALNSILELRHPYLLSLQAIFYHGDRILVVMELADGSLRSPAELLPRGRTAGHPRRRVTSVRTSRPRPSTSCTPTSACTATSSRTTSCCWPGTPRWPTTVWRTSWRSSRRCGRNRSWARRRTWRRRRGKGPLARAATSTAWRSSTPSCAAATAPSRRGACPTWPACTRPPTRTSAASPKPSSRCWGKPWRRSRPTATRPAGRSSRR